MLRGPRVSACMVLYNSGSEALEAARCVMGSTVPVDLHIVDNASKDGMLRVLRGEFPQASFHALERNIGYGSANNVVLEHIRSEYHLILNPDITFEPDLLERMVAFMDSHPDVGILTPRLLFSDGTEQFVPRMEPTVRRLMGGRLGRILPGANQWRDEYTLRSEDTSGPLRVQIASGCFMLIRTHLFFALKGFDERFFLYLEDTDLSHRAALKTTILYHPDFEVTHGWHRDSAHQLKAGLRHLCSAVRYFHKWGWRW